VDKWTWLNVFCRFSPSAFIIVYKVVFISEYFTAFLYAVYLITRSILETTMRSFRWVFLGYAGTLIWTISSLALHLLILSIWWSVDNWLPRGIKIMLYWFRRRFTEEPCLILIGSHISLECTYYVDSVQRRRKSFLKSSNARKLHFAPCWNHKNLIIVRPKWIGRR
jgi:hypothetical protein